MAYASLANLGSEYKTVMEVPDGPAVNYLIGARGVNVSELQTVSGCRIDVGKKHEMKPGTNLRTVTITHTDAAVRANCVELVQQKLQDFYAQEANGGVAPAGSKRPRPEPIPISSLIGAELQPAVTRHAPAPIGATQPAPPPAGALPAWMMGLDESACLQLLQLPMMQAVIAQQYGLMPIYAPQYQPQMAAMQQFQMAGMQHPTSQQGMQQLTAPVQPVQTAYTQVPPQQLTAQSSRPYPQAAGPPPSVIGTLTPDNQTVLQLPDGPAVNFLIGAW
jgi:hypothetical protein